MKNFTYRTLAYLSDYAHADLVYLAKGGFWLTLSQVLTYVGSFALAIVFARNIPAETYGNYTYVLSLFGFFTLFSLPGIDTAVVQSVARGYEGSYYLGFWTKFKWSLVGSAALIAIGGYYFWVGEILLSIALVCGAILTPLTNASELYLSFLGGRKKFATQTKYKAIVQLTSYGSMIAALFLTKNLAILVLVYLLGSVLSNFYLYLRVLRRHKPNHKDDKQAIGYGKHLSVMQALNIGASYVDRFLIFYYLGPVELAIYSFALSPVRQIMSAFANFSHLILPKFSQRTKAEINANFTRRLGQLLIVGMGLYGVYFLIAPVVFEVFFPRYIASVGYSRLFSLVLILQAIAPFLGSVFRSQKLTKSLYISGVSSQVLMIILTLMLGYVWGINGVIWAKIAVPVYSLGLSVFLWKKEVGRKI